ncbi:MAG: cation:proton antiporter regulatory subunit [Ilumatobacteraceae bacterium]|jgi:TrkA domain protein|nr:cation:proton antiporter regulatory subunit [Ilumatobacteraceae bacterium]
MAEVRETRLPGVGVRHDFTAADGTQVAVLVMRDGRRDILVYDRDDPDACTGMLGLSPDDARTLSELLGASQVTEAVAAVQQQIEGLAIEWIEIAASSPLADRTIGDGAFRTRTGASVVAVLRGDDTNPAPGPDFRLLAGDVIVVVGTTAGLALVRSIVQG